MESNHQARAENDSNVSCFTLDGVVAEMMIEVDEDVCVDSPHKTLKMSDYEEYKKLTEKLKGTDDMETVFNVARHELDTLKNVGDETVINKTEIEDRLSKEKENVVSDDSNSASRNKLLSENPEDLKKSIFSELEQISKFIEPIKESNEEEPKITESKESEQSKKDELIIVDEVKLKESKDDSSNLEKPVKKTRSFKGSKVSETKLINKCEDDSGKPLKVINKKKKIKVKEAKKTEIFEEKKDKTELFEEKEDKIELFEEKEDKTELLEEKDDGTTPSFKDKEGDETELSDKTEEKRARSFKGSKLNEIKLVNKCEDNSVKSLKVINKNRKIKVKEGEKTELFEEKEDDKTPLFGDKEGEETELFEKNEDSEAKSVKNSKKDSVNLHEQITGDKEIVGNSSKSVKPKTRTKQVIKNKLNKTKLISKPDDTVNLSKPTVKNRKSNYQTELINENENNPSSSISVKDEVPLKYNKKNIKKEKKVIDRRKSSAKPVDKEKSLENSLPTAVSTNKVIERRKTSAKPAIEEKNLENIMPTAVSTRGNKKKLIDIEMGNEPQKTPPTTHLSERGNKKKLIDFKMENEPQNTPPTTHMSEKSLTNLKPKPFNLFAEDARLGRCFHFKHVFNQAIPKFQRHFYRVLFDKWAPSDAGKMKNEVFQFSGFPFKYHSTEIEKHKHILNKLPDLSVEEIAKMLDIEIQKKREKTTAAILKFLLKPTKTVISVVDPFQNSMQPLVKLEKLSFDTYLALGGKKLTDITVDGAAPKKRGRPSGRETSNEAVSTPIKRKLEESSSDTKLPQNKKKRLSEVIRTPKRKISMPIESSKKSRTIETPETNFKKKTKEATVEKTPSNETEVNAEVGKPKRGRPLKKLPIISYNAILTQTPTPKKSPKENIFERTKALKPQKSSEVRSHMVISVSDLDAGIKQVPSIVKTEIKEKVIPPKTYGKGKKPREIKPKERVASVQVTNEEMVSEETLSADESTEELKKDVAKKKKFIRHGKPLRSFEDIRTSILTGNINSLQRLHILLFGAADKGENLKANILAFGGFPFLEGSEEWKQKEFLLSLLALNTLKEYLNLLCLSFSKEDQQQTLINKLMKFLAAPRGLNDTIDTGSFLPEMPEPSPEKGKKKKCLGH